jgi:putative membrane protein
MRGMTLPPPEQPNPEPPPRELPPVPTSTTVPHTRIGAAWFGVWAGIVVVILLIIFIGQNTAKVPINFLWMHGLIPTALALLIAGVGGAIIATAVAAARIVQLRRLVRHRRNP